MVRGDHAGFCMLHLLQVRLGATARPRPCVAKPERRQQMQHSGRGAAIAHADLDQQILRVPLGIFDEHVKIAVVVEDAGVQQLVLQVVAAAPATGVQQICIGVRGLWVLVEILHIRVGRRAVEVEVVLLDIFAVIAFAVGQSKQPFLQNWILAVPECERKAKRLVVVGDPGQAVLTPAIGPGTRHIMREIIPGVAIQAVVLAHRTPLPFAQIGPPLFPRATICACFVKSALFVSHGLLLKMRSERTIVSS